MRPGPFFWFSRAILVGYSLRFSLDDVAWKDGDIRGVEEKGYGWTKE